MIGKSALGSPLREICTMGSERGDEYKRLRPVGEGTGSKESEYSEAPQRATTSRLVPTHQQDHRAIKRRVRASQGFRSFRAAARTIQGLEMMNMIRKGQVRWLPKADIAGQVAFVGGLLGLTAVA